MQPYFDTSRLKVPGTVRAAIALAAIAFLWNAANLFFMAGNTPAHQGSAYLILRVAGLQKALSAEIENQSRVDGMESDAGAFGKQLRALVTLYRKNADGLSSAATNLPQVREHLQQADNAIGRAEMVAVRIAVPGNEPPQAIKAEAEAWANLALAETRAALLELRNPPIQETESGRRQTAWSLGGSMLLSAAIILLLLFVSPNSKSRPREKATPDWTRKVVELTCDAILTTDTRMLVRSCNPAAERLFGYTSAEMVGKPLPQLLPGGGADRRSTSRSGQMLLTKALLKDGTQVPVEVTLSKQTVGDSTILLLVRASAFEAEPRQRTEALSEPPPLPEDIVLCLGHSLTLINGYSDLLLDAVHPGDANREDIEAIRRAGTQAAEMLDRLYASTPPEQPEMPAEAAAASTTPAG